MTFQLGARALATRPLAGSPALPSVAITTLGTVSTGGPTLTIPWTFTPSVHGDAQTKYRVKVWDDALATLHYDSGWLSGAVTSHGVDVDAEGIPHDSSDVTAELFVVDAANRLVSDVDPFVMDWGTPHCTITDPTNGEIVDASASTLTVAWTFSDDDGANTQGAYRVQVTLKDTGLKLFDSGWVVSADTSLEVPIVLNDGWTYEVSVQLKNNHGIRSD